MVVSSKSLQVPVAVLAVCNALPDVHNEIKKLVTRAVGSMAMPMCKNSSARDIFEATATLDFIGYDADMMTLDVLPAMSVLN